MPHASHVLGEVAGSGGASALKATSVPKKEHNVVPLEFSYKDEGVTLMFISNEPESRSR